MKTLRILPMVVLVSAGWISAYGQDLEPEVPGDQFSLEGALELFKRSESPEEFEKMLNSPDSKVNNLDLNGDGYIDYIRVVDRNEGNVHAFILQALVSESESQDVAVIELEKLANGKAVLQIVGDEDVYGVTTIIEPTREVRTYAGTQTARTVVNVWAWPSVQYIYGPRYAVWVSPWAWHRRPVWYHSWRPVTYVHYYSIWRPYHHYYAPCYTRRVVYAHTIYRPYRRSSVVVRDRYHDRITRYRVEHRDEDRYARSRDDRSRSYTQGKRPSGNSIDPRRNDSNRNRLNPADRNDGAHTTRPANKPRNVTVDRSRDASDANGVEARNTKSVSVRGDDTPGRKVMASPDNNRDRSSVNPNVSRRYTTSERSAPAAMQRDRTEVKAETPTRRPTTVINAPPVRRAPSASSTVERNRPATRPDVQQRSTPRQRAVTSSATRSTRQPASRPSSVNRSRPSASPSVQQRSTPGRSTGATRSDDARRGRR